MQETQIRSLGREDPPEKGMATHSSILAWRIPWSEEPGRLQFKGSKWVRHNWANNTLTQLLKTLGKKSSQFSHLRILNKIIFKADSFGFNQDSLSCSFIWDCAQFPLSFCQSPPRKWSLLHVLDREAWHAVTHGVAKSWTQLSNSPELNWGWHWSLQASAGNHKTLSWLKKNKSMIFMITWPN